MLQPPESWSYWQASLGQVRVIPNTEYNTIKKKKRYVILNHSSYNWKYLIFLIPYFAISRVFFFNQMAKAEHLIWQRSNEQKLEMEKMIKNEVYL